MGIKNDLINDLRKAEQRGDMGEVARLEAEIATLTKARGDAAYARTVKTYVVKPGDSWFKIAGEVYGDQRMAGALMDANPGFDFLAPGMEIRLAPAQSGPDTIPFFSNKTFGRALKIQQGLLDAGLDPSGARITDFDAEELAYYFPDPADLQFAQQVLEVEARRQALATGNPDYDPLSFGDRQAVTAQDPPPLFELTANDRRLVEKAELQGIVEKDPVEEEVQEEKPDPLIEKAIQHGILEQEQEGERKSKRKVRGHPNVDIEESYVSRADDALGVGTSGRGFQSPTQHEGEDEDPTSYQSKKLKKAIDEDAIMQLADPRAWNFNALLNNAEKAGVNVYDEKGQINVAQLSVYIAGEIEANRQQLARELHTPVYNLEEVSEARVAAWLTAIKVHGNSGAFDVGLMLQRSDAELFGLSTTIEEMVEVIAVDGQTKKQKQTYSKEEYNKKYPWQAERTEKVGQSLAAAAIMVGFALMRSDPDLDNPAKAFEKVFGNLTININTNNDSQCDNEVTRISCGTGRLSNLPVNLILHELGHILHSRIEKKYEKEVPDDLEDDKEGQAEKNAILSKLRGQFDPYGNLETEEIKYTDEEGNEVLVAGMGVGKRNTEGFREDEDGVKWQWHTEDDYSNADSKGEIFAEMFLNWAFTQTDAEGNIVGDTGFAANKAGQAMYNWMEEHMSNWVTYASEPYGESWFTVEVDEEEVVDEEKEREYRRWKRKIGFSGLF